MRQLKRILALTTFLACGCGQDPHRTAPVSGTVTLNDKPLVDASVEFFPISKPGMSPGATSRGATNTQGQFTLTTTEGKPGAIVGQHQVQVLTAKATAVPGTERVELSPERVPQRYNARTELKFTVPEEGTGAADFKLQSP